MCSAIQSFNRGNDDDKYDNDNDNDGFGFGFFKFKYSTVFWWCDGTCISFSTGLILFSLKTSNQPTRVNMYVNSIS